MLDYCSNKFLVLKINTNASLLTEKKIHAILRNGVSTIVFSADAADAELYKKLRINGDLKKVKKNVELFNKIKNSDYKSSNIITRVSGVKVNEDQNSLDMEKMWGDLVDQVAFVNYVPTENVYQMDENSITDPCSDLWRRMFIWWDGKVNPCEIDFFSKLEVGNIINKSLSEVWNSELYKQYRKKHINQERVKIKPCNRCQVI